MAGSGAAVVNGIVSAAGAATGIVTGAIHIMKNEDEKNEDEKNEDEKDGDEKDEDGKDENKKDEKDEKDEEQKRGQLYLSILTAGVYRHIHSV